MAEPTESSGRRGATAWNVVGYAVTLLAGGAAGAFINHYYATRQTVVTYSITTTSLGAAETTRSVLPTLRLQLGNTEIPVVYTNTVELAYSGGPELEQASASITLAGASLLGRPVPSGPDPVHQIGCEFVQESNSVVCKVGRISGNSGPYRIVMATDREPRISVGLDAKNARVERSAGQVQARELQPIVWGLVALLSGVSAAVILVNLWTEFRRRLQSETAPLPPKR
jgi:hypothetical protein